MRDLGGLHFSSKVQTVRSFSITMQNNLSQSSEIKSASLAHIILYGTFLIKARYMCFVNTQCAIKLQLMGIINQ